MHEQAFESLAFLEAEITMMNPSINWQTNARASLRSILGLFQSSAKVSM